MRKLISPMTGKVVKINVKVGQEIVEGEDVLIIKALDKNHARGKQVEDSQSEHGEFPQYNILYEYSCNESLDLLAQLVSDSKAENA